MPGTGQPYDGDVAVAACRRRTMPGRNAFLYRLPLVILSVEQEHRTLDAPQDWLRVEVHVDPTPCIRQNSPHPRELKPRLAGRTIYRILYGLSVSTPAQVLLNCRTELQECGDLNVSEAGAPKLPRRTVTHLLCWGHAG